MINRYQRSPLSPRPVQYFEDGGGVGDVGDAGIGDVGIGVGGIGDGIGDVGGIGIGGVGIGGTGVAGDVGGVGDASASDVSDAINSSDPANAAQSDSDPTGEAAMSAAIAAAIASGDMGAMSAADIFAEMNNPTVSANMVSLGLSALGIPVGIANTAVNAVNAVTGQNNASVSQGIADAINGVIGSIGNSSNSSNAAANAAISMPGETIGNPSSVANSAVGNVSDAVGGGGLSNAVGSTPSPLSSRQNTTPAYMQSALANALVNASNGKLTLQQALSLVKG